MFTVCVFGRRCEGGVGTFGLVGTWTWKEEEGKRERERQEGRDGNKI